MELKAEFSKTCQFLFVVFSLLIFRKSVFIHLKSCRSFKERGKDTEITSLPTNWWSILKFTAYAKSGKMPILHFIDVLYLSLE